MTDDAHYNVQNQPPLTPFEDFLVAKGFKLIATCDPQVFELREISFPRTVGCEDSVVRNDSIVRIWRKKNATTVRPEAPVSSIENPQITSEKPDKKENEPDEHPDNGAEDIHARVTVINPEQVGRDRISVAPPPLPSRAPSTDEASDGTTIRSAPPEGIEPVGTMPAPGNVPTIPAEALEDSNALDERLIRPPASEKPDEHDEGDHVHDHELMT